MPQLTTAECLETALAVRRGLKRIRDLPDEHRGQVLRTMRGMTDVHFARLAESKERRQPRASLTIGRHLNRARST